MSNLFFQLTTIAANLIVFFFAGYFLIKYMSKEKELDQKEKEIEQKEGKLDTEYHKIVDTALNKERKILEDATAEADTIIAQAQFATKDTQEKVNQALEEIIADVHTETAKIAQHFVAEYQNSIKEVANKSLSNLEYITKEITGDADIAS
jgi:cell division septum initiation protein DivIVA